MNNLHFIFYCLFFFSCTNHKPVENKLTNNTTAVLNEIKYVSTEKPATLDSLQGEWFANDSSLHVRIYQNTWTELSDEGDSETIEIYLANSFNSNIRSKSGKFIIKVTELKPYLYYEINELTDDWLYISWGGKGEYALKKKK